VRARRLAGPGGNPAGPRRQAAWAAVDGFRRNRLRENSKPVFTIQISL
jgi:hypothetical protein